MITWFTFPDGGLRYDCAACRQRCCRGKGFALGADELVPLLARAPMLAAHVGLRAGGSYAAVDLADGCWFLAGDGNCAIERDHGRALKPSTCRLFPFNRVFRVGDVRVVDVNSVLCPVEDAGGAGVRWAELEAELASFGGSPLVDAPAPVPRELAADWLDTERRAADAAWTYAADVRQFAATKDTNHLRQFAATKDTDPLRQIAATKDTERLRHIAATKDTNHLRQFAAAVGDTADDARAAWARLYGVSDDELDARERTVAPRVALLAPSLRWNALFHKDAAPYPRVLARLPRRLRALAFLGALASRGSGGAPSLRGLSELWQAQGGALDVLASWDEPVKLAQPSFGADVPANLHAALGRLLAGAFRGGRTLGALVEDAASVLAPPERALAIALAASQLDALLPARS